MRDYNQKKDHPDIGSHLSNKEITDIRNGVHLYEKDVVIWKEPQNISLLTLEICTDRIAELTSSMNKFYLIVDLSDTGRPNMEYVNKLKIKVSEMTERGLIGIYIYFEKNILIRTIAKYVAARIGIPVFSVNKTLEEALNEIHKRKNV